MASAEKAFFLMIIENVINLFVFLVKKLSFNDFVLTFSFFLIFEIIVKMLRDLLHVD